jgi:hypothetical protein
MSAVVWHVLVPALAPLAILGLYFTPVSLFGCVNRGLMALAVVFASLIAGIVTGVVGLRSRAKGESSRWWVVSTCILLVPTLLVFGPLR